MRKPQPVAENRAEPVGDRYSQPEKSWRRVVHSSDVMA